MNNNELTRKTANHAGISSRLSAHSHPPGRAVGNAEAPPGAAGRGRDGKILSHQFSHVIRRSICAANRLAVQPGNCDGCKTSNVCTSLMEDVDRLIGHISQN